MARVPVRRKQQDEAREARLARLTADQILREFTDVDGAYIRDRVRSGFASIGRGEYTDYVGREDLGHLAAGVKYRGREQKHKDASRR